MQGQPQALGSAPSAPAEGAGRCSEEGADQLIRVNLLPAPTVQPTSGPQHSAGLEDPVHAPREAQVPALPRAHGSPNPSQGVKEFKCEVCGREFTLQANMKRHMLIHTSVRPYQCHICFKTFVQKQTLKTHMIVHSPVKPFKCKVPLRVRGGG